MGLLVVRARGSARVWLGVAIGAVFLFLAIRKAEWRETVNTLREVDVPLTLLGVALFVITFILFALRWRVLLSGVGRLRVADTFSHIMIGYLGNTVLPLRLGDLVRTTLTARKHRIGVVSVLSSVVLERVLDLLSVLALVLGLSFFIDVPPVVRGSMVAVTGAALGALAILFVLAANESRMPGLADRMTRFLPRTLEQGLSEFISSFAAGLRTLRQRRQLAVVALLSAAAWGVAGAATGFWVEAFHSPAPWYAGFFVVALVNLGGAIPSSPGSIGVYHYLAVLALSVWVADQSVALGYAIGSHALYILVIVVLGLASLSREGFGLLRNDYLASVSEGPREPVTLGKRND